MHSPHLENLRSLSLPDAHFSKLIINSPWIKNLEKLYIGPSSTLGARNEQKVISLVKTCPKLKDVKIHTVVNEQMGNVLGNLKSLEKLYLHSCSMPGCEAFLENLPPGILKKLHINKIEEQVLAELLKSPKLENLEELHFNHFVDHKMLEKFTHFSALTSLTFHRGCDFLVINRLAQSPNMKNLIHLHLYETEISLETATLLANTVYLENLKTLQLYGCLLKDECFKAIATSPYLKGLQELKVRSNCLTEKSLQCLYGTTLVSLKKLDISNNRGMNKAGKLLAGWPNLVQLEYLNIEKSFNKKDREILAASKNLFAKVEGLPEYSNTATWRNMEVPADIVYDTMAILGKRQDIIKEVKKQISLWAQKFNIALTFTSDHPGICVDIKDIGKNILTKSQKESGEPQVSDMAYAVALMEEAKRKIADAHQEQITKIYFEK